jgi:hypothetical protein
MACRNCCSACEGNVPGSWSVTIDTHEYTLVRSKTGCNGDAVASSSTCVWNLAIDQELWECETGACIEFSAQLISTVDGLKTDWLLRVDDADNQPLAFWLFREDYPGDCMEAKTLTRSVGVGSCESGAEATLEITPGPIGKCCPCSACCDQCSGGSSTAAKWRVTLDGHTFSVPRRVKADLPEDGDTSAICIWSKRINTELFGTMAKDLVVRLYTDGSGIPVYYAEVELFKTDDTRHTLWQNGALSAHNCGVDIENVNYSVGIGSSQSEVVLEPLGLKWCPQAGSATCSPCQPTTPPRFQIDISGSSTSGTSACCPDLQGTYILEPVPAQPCRWVQLIDPEVCNAIEISLTIGANFYYVDITKTGGWVAIFYLGPLSNPRDCEVTELEIPVRLDDFGNSGDCGKNFTCLLTALDT